MRAENLRLESVTYKENDVTLLDNVSFHIFAGEIFGLNPINSVGLDALLALLEQNLPLHYGYVYYRERLVNSWRHPAAHSYNRVGIIESRSRLVGDLTVADNIFVLRHGFRKNVINPEVLRCQLVPFLQEIGIHISAEQQAGKLSQFDRCVAELLKAVVAGNRVIVLRDMAAFLGPVEMNHLYRIMKHYTAKGFSFLYISQHHEEALQICDRLAIMVNGRLSRIFARDELNFDLCEAYSRAFNERVHAQLHDQIGPAEDAPVIFSLQDFVSRNGAPWNLNIRTGECVVLQDVENTFVSGMTAILTGEAAPAAGKILLCGAPFLPKGNREIAILAENPTATMLFSQMSCADNLCFTMDQRMPALWRRHRLKRSILDECMPDFPAELYEEPTTVLDERRRYDLVYGRVLLQKPKIVFCVQPFSHADAQTRAYIWEKLKLLLQKGIAVALLTVSLADSLTLADRVLCIHASGAVREYRRADFGTLPISTPWRTLYQEALPTAQPPVETENAGASHLAR